MYKSVSEEDVVAWRKGFVDALSNSPGRAVRDAAEAER
jgi:hypothetical protein